MDTKKALITMAAKTIQERQVNNDEARVWEIIEETAKDNPEIHDYYLSLDPDGKEADEIVEQSITLAQNESMVMLGQLADDFARQNAFTDYLSRKSENTIKRQKADLDLFAKYLNIAAESQGLKLNCTDLQNMPECWHGISYGLVEGFRNWMLQEGYAVGSVNVRLSTIRTYAKLANKAEVLSVEDYLKIKNVYGYSRKEQVKVNDKRQKAGIDTRTGDKKEKGTVLNLKQIRILKTKHENTLQGKRDKFLMHILLDLGLRCGEVALLKRGNFDIEAGTLTFYRPKVDKEQTMQLPPELLIATKAWFEAVEFTAEQPALKATLKSGAIDERYEGMSERAITKRVKSLGKTLLDIDNLSAHDCRHTWATLEARSGTALDRLMQAGGWNSYAMPLRYIEAAQIANEGTRLFR